MTTYHRKGRERIVVITRTPEERDELRAAAVAAGQDLSRWILDAALARARAPVHSAGPWTVTVGDETVTVEVRGSVLLVAPRA
ncbi:MAG TPA: hypothetical protein DCQ64_03645 [Candidatus Rokubacteria bacterium]|nr:hypothetical protein [Candidatus Rokubacteria bacterium]